MANPYLIEGPAFLSFSGGRTIAYMLIRFIDAYGGSLPPGVIACFANTGKEVPQTLDFVHECGVRWDVPITWLEYDPDDEKQRKFRIVERATASREGKPFEALVKERRYLPNPVTRFCTITLNQLILDLVETGTSTRRSKYRFRPAKYSFLVVMASLALEIIINHGHRPWY